MDVFVAQNFTQAVTESQECFGVVISVAAEGENSVHDGYFFVTAV